MMDARVVHTNRSQYKRLTRYTCAISIFFLLTPTFPTIQGMPGVRLDDFFLCFAPFYLAMIAGRLTVDLRIVIIFLIALTIQTGILIGASMGYPASLSDHFYIVRLWKYCGAVFLATALLEFERNSGDSLRWAAKTLSKIGIILLILVVQQYYDLFDLNTYYVQFVAPTQYETLIGGYPWPRPVGMIGNPNELGFLLGILCICSAWLFFQEEHKNIRWILLSAVFLFGSALTLSRSSIFATITSIGSLAIGFMLISIRKFSERIVIRKRPAKFVFLLFLVFITAIVGALLSEAIYNSVSWRFMPEHYGGWYRRLENWQENIDLWSQSPLFGVGTLRHAGFIEHAADNEWLLLLRTGGVALAVLAFTLYVVGVFDNKTPAANRNLSLALTLGAATYMIPAAFFYSLVIMPMALILWTLATPSPLNSIRSERSARQATNLSGSGSKERC